MRFHIKLRSFAGIDDLRRKIARWESLGIAGVTVSDHLFSRRGPGSSHSQQRHDPYVVLSAIGTMSTELDLALLVTNTGYSHPFFAIRQFSELAYLFGGDRVYAGLGAGWNAEEFDSLGFTMAPHGERVERLEESVALARLMFDRGAADFYGNHVEARDLPLSPSIGRAARLTVGGGSRAVMRIAAKYADHLDFDAPSHRLPLTGTRDGETSRTRDVKRRLVTTDDDLAESRRILSAMMREMDRPDETITTSINVTALKIGEPADLPEVLRSLNARFALNIESPQESSGAHHSPFVLLGSKEELSEAVARRADRLGLSFMVLPDCDDTEVFVKHFLR